ncbi:hypothetical protein KY328_03075, partial [Candidatus Woesearchaeota archaeon]|nr:hypothetical protein [Candidatus Woesearchaeota archaeon]
IYIVNKKMVFKSFENYSDFRSLKILSGLFLCFVLKSTKLLKIRPYLLVAMIDHYEFGRFIIDGKNFECNVALINY